MERGKFESGTEGRNVGRDKVMGETGTGIKCQDTGRRLGPKTEDFGLCFLISEETVCIFNLTIDDIIYFKRLVHFFKEVLVISSRHT